MKNKTHMIISKDTSIQKNLAFICDENFQWTRNRKQILHFEKGCLLIGLPRRLSGKESASAGDAGDTGDAALIPGSETSPGGGNGDPLQYSCLENSMDRATWWITVHERGWKRWTRLSDWARIHTSTKSALIVHCILKNFWEKLKKNRETVHDYGLEDSMLIWWKFSSKICRLTIFIKISLHFCVEIDDLLLKCIWKW